MQINSFNQVGFKALFVDAEVGNETKIRSYVEENPNIEILSQEGYDVDITAKGEDATAEIALRDQESYELLPAPRFTSYMYSKASLNRGLNAIAEDFIKK